MNYQTFEEYLQEHFIEKLEVGGMPITKDNCEDMFATYLEDIDKEILIDLAEKWNGQEIQKAITKTLTK